MAFSVQGIISEKDLQSGHYHLLYYSTGIEMTIIDMIFIKTEEKQSFKLDFKVSQNKLTKKQLSIIMELDFDFEIQHKSLVTIDKSHTTKLLKESLVTNYA